MDLLSSLVIFTLMTVQQTPAEPVSKPSPEQAILDKVPGNWYQSTTNVFKYCVDVNFNHPICPQINRGFFGEFNFQSEFFTPPVGPLNPRSLFQANVLYQVNRPPVFWFVGLNLKGPKPASVDDRLWAEARWLWARILFDQRKYTEALSFFDQIVGEFKGKGLFHQQRAWTQYFTKKFDQSLGSIVSAESPLIYPVPFPEKYFLRALIEKEMCQYSEAINTINVGRDTMKTSSFDQSKHPWVVLCERESLGTKCSRLEAWYQKLYAKKVSAALDDLDLLEIELKDRLTPGQKKKSKSSIIWPKGEGWRDELGNYSVPIENKCNG